MATATLSHIRWMVLPDISRAVEISERSFEPSHSADWFLHQFNQRDTIPIVVEVDGKIAGWMVYQLSKHHLRLISVAVDPAYRRQGVGVAMLNRLKSKLTPERRWRLSCSVHDSNLPCHLWLRNQGFVATGINDEQYEFCYFVGME